MTVRLYATPLTISFYIKMYLPLNAMFVYLVIKLGYLKTIAESSTGQNVLSTLQYQHYILLYINPHSS